MNAMTETRSVAVVGCGYWGKNLVRNFHKIGALAAVSDCLPENAARMSAEFGVPALSFSDVLSLGDIHGVVIATPAAMHYSMVREALLAGKDVFVEKPLALTADEGAALSDLAQAQNRILMVGHLLQYHPAFLKLKEIAAKGDLGFLNYAYSHRLNLGKIRNEENSLWSFAPHDVSMILALMGDDVEDVSATGQSFLNKGITDVTTTHIRFASGRGAHIFVSWLHPFKEQRLVVVGDEGMAVFDDGEPWERKLVLFRHRVRWVNDMPVPEKAESEAIPLTPTEPLLVECQHFIDRLIDRQTPQTDGREGVAVLRILQAADQSIAASRRPAAPPAEPPVRPWFAHETACVDEPASIGAGTRIWHFSHVLKDTTIGTDCNIGQNVVIGPDVRVGNGCKIQNNVSIYGGVTLEDGVFCGPSMVFTNVLTPRAEVNRRGEFTPTLVRRGASIGANATIVCGTTIGRYAMIGAGAVVTRDVADYTLVVGNPARILGHVCACGERLSGPGPILTCRRCDSRYRLNGHQVTPLAGDA